MKKMKLKTNLVVVNKEIKIAAIAIET